MSRYILSIIICILIITDSVSAAIIYPSATPSAETTGGTFNQYFTNMFTPTCTSGQMISGFSSNGVPICITGVGASYWNSNNGGSTIYFTGAGNVGIGTTTPSYKLHVNGAGYFGDPAATYNPSTYSQTYNYSINLGPFPISYTYYNQYDGGYWGNLFMGGAGMWSGQRNTLNGQFNQAIGGYTLGYITSGSSNNVFGWGGLASMTVGSANTAIGRDTGYSLTTGSSNVFLGTSAGNTLTSGSNNIVIGASSQVASTTGSNQLSIGNWIYGNGGNIGIGVSAPGAKLEVAGQVKITGGTPGAGKVLTSDATGLASWQSASSQWTNNSYGIHYNAGNIGLGSTSPLDGKISIINTRGSFDFGVRDPASYLQYTLGTDSSMMGLVVRLWNGGGVRFNNAWDTVPLMFISGGGNVGIGTSAPTAKLDVNGEIKSTFSYVQKTGSYSDGGGSTPFNKWLRVLSTENPYSGISYGELLIVAKGRADGFARVVFSCSGYGNCDISVPENTIPMTSSLTDTSGGLQGVRVVYDSSTFANPAYLDIEIRNDGGSGNTSYTIYLIKGGNMTLSSALTDATTSAPVASYIDLRTPTNSVAHAFSKGKILFMNDGKMQISAGTPGAGKVLTSDATGLASWQSASSQWTTNGSNIYYNSTGNVGIGSLASSPLAKLHIFANSWSTDFLRMSSNGGYTFSFKSSNGGDLILKDETNARELININPFTNRLIFPWYDVGIGTTTPGAKLEVAGQVKITGGAPGAGKVLTSDATGLASWQTASNTSPFGSTNAGWGGNGGFRLTTNAVDTGGGMTENQVNSSRPNWVLDVGGIGYTFWDGFRISRKVPGGGSFAYTDYLSILSNGNLGIGVSSPTKKLDVAGDINFTGDLYKNGVLWTAGASATTWASITAKSLGDTARNDSTLDIGVSQYMRWKNYGNSHIIIDASNSTAPNGSAINNTNSQVVWSATYPTLMGWNGANTYGVRVDSARVADGSAGTTSSRFWMPDSDESAGGAKSIHANSNVIGFLNGGGNWLQYTNDAGQIWTANYGWLHDRFLGKSGDTVSEIYNNGWYRSNGNAGWYSQSYGGGWWMTDPTWIRSYGGKYMYVDSVIQAGAYMNSPAYYYISDARLKKDLVKITSSLDKVTAMNGYYFKWKKDDKKDIGLIAQEVEKIFPDAVGEYTDPDSKKTYKNVEYGHLIAPVVEAIKELATLVKSDKADIIALKSENELLKKRLDAIEARLR